MRATTTDDSGREPPYTVIGIGDSLLHPTRRRGGVMWFLGRVMERVGGAPTAYSGAMLMWTVDILPFGIWVVVFPGVGVIWVTYSSYFYYFFA